MVIRIMPWQGKMFIIWAPVGACYIVSVGVYPFVGFGFTFSYVLGFGAENAIY